MVDCSDSFYINRHRIGYYFTNGLLFFRKEAWEGNRKAKNNVKKIKFK